MSEGYRGKPVAVVQQNKFQRSLAAVNEQSPIFWLVALQACAEAVQYPYINQFLLFIEKTEVLFMHVAVEGDASTVREGVLFLQSGCQQFGRGR